MSIIDSPQSRRVSHTHNNKIAESFFEANSNVVLVRTWFKNRLAIVLPSDHRIFLELENTHLLYRLFADMKV